MLLTTQTAEWMPNGQKTKLPTRPVMANLGSDDESNAVRRSFSLGKVHFAAGQS
jgi:hypothetical protein